MDWVRDLRENQQFEGIFLIRSVDQRFTREGKIFLEFVLADKTGEVRAVWWDPPPDKLGSFTVNSVVFAKGVGRVYQGKTELHLESLVVEKEYDIGRFWERAEMPVEEAISAMQKAVDEISQPHLRELLKHVLGREEWKIAPAAKSFHHAVIGGLAEHTATLLSFVPHLIKIYPMLNRDVLIAGIILHDVGKLFELSLHTKIEFTTEGKLLGHIAQGVLFLEQLCREIPDFPESLKTELAHIILSHHGNLEFGSPVLPKTLEALVIHYIDDLDAKLWSFWHHIRSSPDEESVWKGYHKEMRREIYYHQERGDEGEAG
ncbi:MAG: 3'-5' exoribonuclease YhaM family protein [bacterium JZ-2024 1]